MRPKSIVLLIVALGCGLVSAIGINKVISREPVTVAGDAEAIFVTMVDIGLNELVTPAMIKLEPWPKDKIPPGAITKLEDVQERRTRVRLFSGEPLLEAKLLPKGEQVGSVGVQIPKGFRVVAVRVDEVASTGSMLLPGDRVDVVVHLTQGSAPDVLDTMSKTFLRDVKVFAVNDTVDREHGDDGKITARTVSLLVKPDQAEKVTLADSLGKIRLVMRNPEDDVDVTEGSADVRDLLELADKPSREEEEEEKTAVVQPVLPVIETPEPDLVPEDTGHVMTIIRGDAVEEVTLDAGSKIARHKDGIVPADPIEEPFDSSADDSSGEGDEPAGDEGDESAGDDAEEGAGEKSDDPNEGDKNEDENEDSSAVGIG